MTPARPAFDPDLRRRLADMPFVPELNRDVLPQIRPFSSMPIEPLLDGRAVEIGRAHV